MEASTVLDISELSQSLVDCNFEVVLNPKTDLPKQSMLRRFILENPVSTVLDMDDPKHRELELVSLFD